MSAAAALAAHRPTMDIIARTRATRGLFVAIALMIGGVAIAAARMPYAGPSFDSLEALAMVTWLLGVSVLTRVILIAAEKDKT